MRDVIRESYYRHRAPVYDATSYRGDPEVDAGLDREAAEIGQLLKASQVERVLEVGAGTGVWTQFLPGDVTAMDQSTEMLDIARSRAPKARLVQALFPPLPFADNAFDTLFTANFYGLLRTEERRRFMDEARRVARRLMVLDLRSDTEDHTEGIEERNVDGVVYPIFRRRFTPDSLREELDAALDFTGDYFLVATADLRGLT